MRWAWCHRIFQRADLTGRLSGKTVLELRPGDSEATALIAKAHGARLLLVDTGRYALPELSTICDSVRVAGNRHSSRMRIFIGTVLGYNI